MNDTDLINIAKLQQEICSKYQSEFCPMGQDEMIVIALQTLDKSPIHG